MKVTYSKLLVSLLSLAFYTPTFSQCETWLNSSEKDYLEGQHSVYRGLIKTNNFSEAIDPWKEVYEKAPAADGRRDFHYTDGIKIYKNLLENESDETKREEYIHTILRLYDEAIACYESKVIRLKCTTDECYSKQISSMFARKAYDMYYSFRSPYSETILVLQKAMDIGGLDAQYTIVVPFADIAVYQFANEDINKAEAREVHDALLNLCEVNANNGNKYAAYYQQARDAMKGKFREIEDFIFDCDYFKEMWMAEYEENADDPQYARSLYNRLRQKGCTEEDPFMQILGEKWESYAEAENARRQAEFEANNPGLLAKRAYDAGDFNGAIKKYREAIEGSDDLSENAGYHFSIASIMFRKLNNNGAAKSEAMKAAKLRPGWGRPYVLIGDIYAKSARRCGDSWNQRLAVLAAYDKWAYSRTRELDPKILSDVTNKMSKYRASFPTKDEGFMRGVKPGSKATVGCWIGETVKVRYQ